MHFTTAFFAILRAGLVPVMVLPAHGFKEISHFIETSGAKAFVTADQPNSQDKLALKKLLADKTSLIEHFYCIGTTNEHNTFPSCSDIDLANFTPATINPEHPALFLVSNGTTGLPKLLPRTHNDYHYNATCSAKACQLSAQNVYLAVLPAAHNFPLACPGILGTLSVSGKVVFTSHSSPDHCFDLIEAHHVTATVLVPALAQMWTCATQWEATDISSLKLLQVGGAKLSEIEAKKINAAFPRALQQVFGMVEGLVCFTDINMQDDTHIYTQGWPMSEFDEWQIVDSDGKPLPAGCDGELLVRGSYTLRGDYRADTHNAHAFTEDGFYRSGDRVTVKADGSFIVTGRIKDVINRGGEKIASDEIEEMLLTHEAIRQVAVVPVPDKDFGERVGAAIVFNGASIELKEIRRYLSALGMAHFKLPERLKTMESLPLIAVGKVAKSQIVIA